MDIRFFQAAATVLPTLLIAYALHSRDTEIKRLAGIASRKDKKKSRGSLFGQAAILILFVVGEMLALLVLALNNPQIWAFVGVLGAILSLAWFVCYETLWPLMENHGGKRLAQVFLFGPTLVILTCFALFLWLLGVA